LIKGLKNIDKNIFGNIKQPTLLFSCKKILTKLARRAQPLQEIWQQALKFDPNCQKNIWPIMLTRKLVVNAINFKP